MVVFTICMSRCLYCGRQTPHEVCHDCHAKSMDPNWNPFPDGITESIYNRFDEEPEKCEEFECPLWDGSAPEWLSQVTNEERLAIFHWKHAGPSVA